MKASAVLLLAIAAVAIGQPAPDIKGKIAELHSQEQKWAKVLGASAGYVMKTSIGDHFLPKDERSSQKLCPLTTIAKAVPKPHLLGQDDASLPPQFRGLRKPHLLGEDEASRPLPAGRRQRRRRSINPAQLLGADKASLPPMAGALSLPHSISDVFGLLRKVMTQGLCKLSVMYHKTFGHPLQFTVTGCKNMPKLIKTIAIPKIMIIKQVAKLGKMCSAPIAINRTARPLVHHLIMLSTLSQASNINHPNLAAAAFGAASGLPIDPLFGVGPVIFPGMAQAVAKKAQAEAKKTLSSTPSPLDLAADLLKSQRLPIMYPQVEPKKISKLAQAKAKKLMGSTLSPLDLAADLLKSQRLPVMYPKAEPKRAPLPPRSQWMKTGDNPAIFSDINPPKAAAHHDGKEHGSKHHGHAHHGKEHHGHAHQVSPTSASSKFITYWRHKDQQFRHFIIRHPWALPAAFAAFGVLISAVILVSLHIRNKRRRAAAATQESCSLISEDKKVLIDEKPASFYVNEICA